MSWLSQTADAEPALDVASPVSRAVHGIWEADELFRCPLVGHGDHACRTETSLEENVASGG